jgi:hypothetical protein
METGHRADNDDPKHHYSPGGAAGSAEPAVICVTVADPI